MAGLNRSKTAALILITAVCTGIPVILLTTPLVNADSSIVFGAAWLVGGVAFFVAVVLLVYFAFLCIPRFDVGERLEQGSAMDKNLERKAQQVFEDLGKLLPSKSHMY